MRRPTGLLNALLALLTSIHVCRPTRISIADDGGVNTLSNASTTTFACKDTSARRTCWASRRTTDGIAAKFCNVLRGKDLNWRCHCPKVKLGGAMVQSHHRTGSCRQFFSRWQAFAQPVQHMESENVPSQCVSFVKKVVLAMRVSDLFGPIPVDGSLRAKTAIENAWNISAPQALFSTQVKQTLDDEYNAYTFSELTFQQITSYETYKFERKRLKTLKLVEESDSNTVQSTKVTSICTLSLAFLWDIRSSRDFFKSLSSGGTCTTVVNKQAFMRDSLVDICFSTCINQIRRQPWVPLPTNTEQSCSFPVPPDFATIFDQEGCAGVPSDTFIALVEWVFQTICWKFPPPSVLWRYGDKAPHAEHDTAPHEVCAEVDEGEYARGSQQVFCNEGSACACPKQQVTKTKTVDQLRAAGYSSGAADIAKGVSTQAVAMTIAQHIGPIAPAALVILAIKDVAKRDWARLAGMGVAVGTGVALHMVGLPIVVIAAPLWLLKAGVTHALTSCEKTLGCWPVMPVLYGKNASHFGNCAMPLRARDGGSSVWFLPPPGTVLRPKNFGWSPQGELLEECVMDGCEFRDHVDQRVGFHDRRTLNCQPLVFEDMTLFQKQEFYRAFQTSCSSEGCDNVRQNLVDALGRAVRRYAPNDGTI